MTRPSTIRVLIADDHPAMREGLAHAVSQEADMAVVAEAGDGVEAVDQFRATRPHVALIDLQMPRMNGLEAIAAIREIDHDAIVVVLTTYPGDARVVRALTLGATSYLLKSSSTAEILSAIRSAIDGRQVLGADVRQDMATHAGSESLTKRELSVLKLAAMGYGNRDIGEALGVSEETIKSRIRSILGKLDASDRTHAVTLAIQRGFLEI
ncbi:MULTISPECIES: response regulator transcription factor [Rhodanobacteraceae]|uniref:response regulator transcription factor n=1 Tax=Rhodanobacteraceae TaxID=1775411 RepID=UPI00087EF9EA|nr:MULTISPECIES: response regulator transcription factor [Rhodanobacteraceae]SDF41035.1 DNA-binding response regulator, NarL/FixJ family, contains REC and HTH domains [Dyella sp. 333MFSha]SKB27578.1 two component transcriptional regulator, LuxR family [Luteibacter sp. 22Crub2.1]